VLISQKAYSGVIFVQEELYSVVGNVSWISFWQKIKGWPKNFACPHVVRISTLGEQANFLLEEC
jgi:hypothetical protein